MKMRMIDCGKITWQFFPQVETKGVKNFSSKLNNNGAWSTSRCIKYTLNRRFWALPFLKNTLFPKMILWKINFWGPISSLLNVIAAWKMKIHGVKFFLRSSFLASVFLQWILNRTPYYLIKDLKKNLNRKSFIFLFPSKIWWQIFID